MIDTRISYNRTQTNLFNFDKDTKFCSRCGEEMKLSVDCHKTKKGILCRDCVLSINNR